MKQNKTDLSLFSNQWYRPGGRLKMAIWYVVNHFIFNGYWFPFSGIKCALLVFFGAKIGKGVVIKPKVNIKYPWFLEIGDNTWIGEDVWIDNLAEVKMGANVCLSQGVLILSGNHNYNSVGFDLMLKKIHLEDGVWIGAKSIVVQGCRCDSHAVVGAGSVAKGHLQAYTIYGGNPAVKIGERLIQ